jgi:hypothetical protein
MEHDSQLRYRCLLDLEFAFMNLHLLDFDSITLSRCVNEIIIYETFNEALKNDVGN